MVYEDILRTEAKERSMLLWLRNLRIHSFTPRHFENVNLHHLDNNVTRIPSSNSRNSIEDKIGQNTSNNEEKQSKDICDVEIKSTANHILPHDNVILDDEKEPMPKRTKQT